MTAERVPALDCAPTTVGLLRHALERWPDHPFIVEPERTLTYAEVERLSRMLARRLLLLGVTKGSRVAARYPNGAQWVIVWLAVTRIGGFFMPLSSVYTAGEMSRCLRIGDAEFLLTPTTIVGRDQRHLVAEVLGRPLDGLPEPLMLRELPYLRRVLFTRLGHGDPPAPEDAAIDLAAPDPALERQVPDAFLAEVESEVTPADWMLAIFTSGSTSDPKCVVHTHGGPIRHGTAIVALNAWTGDDRIFAGMPFFWVGGNCYTVIPAMLVGATLICMERFEPGAALDLMERVQATRITGWPGVINPLLEHPSLPARSIPALSDPQWSPRVFWATGLGMSETASNHTAVYLAERAAAEGSVGRAIPGIEHRIVDEETGDGVAPGTTGTIQVRGYCVMAGLYKREREETFTPDGFYDTRDRGFLRGVYLCFAGRDLGLIKTAGNNVSAPEVEAALRARPGVANAFVVGLDDPAVGQIVGAAVVPEAGAALDLPDLLAALRRDLSPYKVPRVVRVLAPADVPFLSNGKLDYRALVALVAQGRPVA